MLTVTVCGLAIVFSDGALSELISVWINIYDIAVIASKVDTKYKQVT